MRFLISLFLLLFISSCVPTTTEEVIMKEECTVVDTVTIDTVVIEDSL